MTRDESFDGRMVLLTAGDHHLIADIDTDQIFHNQYLHITEIEEMGRYALGNLEGWKDFPSTARPGDVLVAGPNFGAGSSRQHAVDCFRALGVRLIIAQSFGAIYKRNAINTGMPIIEFPEAAAMVDSGKWTHLMPVRVDLSAGTVSALETGETRQLPPLSKVQRDIMSRGTLLKI